MNWDPPKTLRKGNLETKEKLFYNNIIIIRMYQARQIYIWLNKQCSRSIISFLKIWLRLSPIWFPIEENLWNQKIDIPRRFPKTNNSYIGNAIMSTSCCPYHWFICRESQMKNKTNQMLLAKFLFQLDFFLFSRPFIFDSKIFEQISTILSNMK